MRHIVREQRTGAVLAVRSTATRATYASALIIVALGLAIACFAVSATPAEHLRRRRGAALIAYRSREATTAGLACLLVALVVFLLTRAG